MSKVLLVESSARQQGSVSRQLAEQFVQHWQARNAANSVTVKDLAANPLPHLDEQLLASWMLPAEQHSAEQQAALARSDQAIAELKDADVLVLGVPMYNFSIPSTLKAWIDHVLRAGVTFKYTEQGPQGLLSGKRAVVLTARGGVYAGSPNDYQAPYLQQVLAFIGITDVQFIHAEGLNMGPEMAEKGVASAQEQLNAWFATNA